MRTRQTTIVAGAACALVLGTAAVPASAVSGATSAPDERPRTVASGFVGPRGVANVRPGVTLVAEQDGTIKRVREHRHRKATVRTLTRVPAIFAPAIARGRNGMVYILTGTAEGDPDNPSLAPKPVRDAQKRLFKWRPGWKKPRVMANIGAYQKAHPDKADLEKNPTESNPFGVAALRNGSVLVADAAGNDLLKVRRDGKVSTVAVLRPRVVKVPEGLPETGPDGEPSGLPPAGTPIPSEAVATSVTVGRDGYYYVGELRGFPATPGTSQIWRIHPRSHRAVCDPKHPQRGRCKRFADGLTSIVDLAPGRNKSVYALSLSKKSWFQLETGGEGAQVGGLFRVKRGHHRVRELGRGHLTTPGAVDTGRKGTVYVTGPVFGPGTLSKLHP